MIQVGSLNGKQLRGDKEGKKASKRQAFNILEENRQRLSDMQELFWASDNYSMLIVLQGMDAAGKVSPVKEASLTKRFFDSRIMASPGIRSPALRMMMSPGTIFSTDISFEAPSRRTAALVSTIASSFSTALAAPRSCQNPRRLLMRMIVMIIIAFVGKVPKDTSRYNDNPPAKMRMRISGLLN
jgi:hypothetical protein